MYNLYNGNFVNFLLTKIIKRKIIKSKEKKIKK